jgi:hypothetical protein
MTKAYEAEFATVDLLLRSGYETRGVDAFCLSWIKYERQLRRIVAFLLYQSDQLTSADATALRNAFLDNNGIAHGDMRSAIFRLSGHSTANLLDGEYRRLKTSLDHSYKIRQKLLHGQQSGQSLSRSDLVSRIAGIREWCSRMSASCEREIGYDGFARAGSLRKATRPELAESVAAALSGGSWEAFVKAL